MLQLWSFLLENFNDFKEYEKNAADHGDQASHQFRNIVKKKIKACIYILELFRLSCENHYSEMQNFLREQHQKNGKPKINSINLVKLIAELFEKYASMINENNIILGEKLLDTLIEFIQGPCIENQLVLAHTNLLEHLEDILSEMQTKNTYLCKINERIAGFTHKITTFLLGLFEANNDPFVLNKISNYVDPDLVMKKITKTYIKYYKGAKKAMIKDFLYRYKRKKQKKKNVIFRFLHFFFLLF